MKSDHLLTVVFVVLIIISVISIFSIISSLSRFTGYASGYVNVTLSTEIIINLTRDSINWGPGSIIGGNTNATLITKGENALVERGNWSTLGVSAFIIENIGNVNCSLYLQSQKNASSFFNSLTGTNQEFMFNVSNREENSCSGTNISEFLDVNITSPGTRYCNQFSYNRQNNEVYLDVYLTVPYDAENTGFLTDTITVTADTAA